MKIKKTFIIAEAGVNHNGSIEIAKKLIEAAKSSGADAIKFQSFKAEKLVTKSASKAHYQKNETSPDETQFEMIKKLELSDKDFFELSNYAKKRKIQFLSSPFDEESADLLEQIGISIFKIPSGEINNLSFLEHIAKKNRKIILSTGMASLGEIEDAVKSIHSTGNKNLVLLHCTTAYPAPYNEINLNAIKTLRDVFKIPVGYSDHTIGIEIALAAVALGAEVIEKHFTLDRNMKGPDQKASLEPDEFSKMVISIRNIKESLGDGIKSPTFSEIKNIHIVRKSIVLSQNIKRGGRLNFKNTSIKRPGTGIEPKMLKFLIGMKVNKNLPKDTILRWDDLK